MRNLYFVLVVFQEINFTWKPQVKQIIRSCNVTFLHTSNSFSLGVSASI